MTPDLIKATLKQSTPISPDSGQTPSFGDNLLSIIPPRPPTFSEYIKDNYQDFQDFLERQLDERNIPTETRAALQERINALDTTTEFSQIHSLYTFYKELSVALKNAIQRDEERKPILNPNGFYERLVQNFHHTSENPTRSQQVTQRHTLEERTFDRLINILLLEIVYQSIFGPTDDQEFILEHLRTALLNLGDDIKRTYNSQKHPRYYQLSESAISLSQQLTNKGHESTRGRNVQNLIEQFSQFLARYSTSSPLLGLTRQYLIRDLIIPWLERETEPGQIRQMPILYNDVQLLMTIRDILSNQDAQQISHEEISLYFARTTGLPSIDEHTIPKLFALYRQGWPSNRIPT